MAFAGGNAVGIAELLEREEKKAKERIRLEKAAERRENAFTDTQMGGMPSSGDGRLERSDFFSSSYPVDDPHSSSSRPTSSNGPTKHINGDRKYTYTNERSENDERRARRSQHDPFEDDAQGGTDRDSINGTKRRSRSRSPRPDSRRSHRSRERISGGDFYRGGGRYSADRDDDDDRYYRPGSDRRGPRRESRDRGGRDRGGRDDRDRRVRERDTRGSHDNHRSPAGGYKRKTPEPTDDERDRRTVFVQQLAARLRSKDLKVFFEAAGPVVDAQIVKDRVSGRSKGVGYVEFKDEESVQKAIGLTGQKLMGIPIIAQLTEAEKNRQARTNEGGATHSNGIPFHRLYVGNIHFSISEEDLKTVFQSFGDLEFVQLQKEEGGRSKGYGFVQFVDPAEAKKALESMNGFELAGRPIRVGLGNDKFTPESTQNLMQRFGNQGNHQGSSFSGMGGRGTQAGGTGNFDRPAARDLDKAGGAGALDDSDVGGVNFSNYSRDALMRKLARTDEPEQKIAPKYQASKPIVVQSAPSRCIVAKNMYDENTKDEGPNWKELLQKDIEEECNATYGKVVHVGIPPDGDQGQVYIKFAELKGGEKALRGLNGRYFDGKMVTADTMVEAVYNMNFPQAKNA
ncbi:RNA-binding rsd1 [Lecanosticta acicola]|uniref:RNA-binding rsd1 n=1 Tax=Lecanosticta acicola TaxID=111012 RepID=A0AAI8Z453_9PEZI|nr:RNA-binding rsd1 [Lecanosticta acicola]